MRLRIDYHGWEPADPLDPEAASVLRFLEQFAESRLQSEVGEVVASIDMYGVVQAYVPVGTTHRSSCKPATAGTAFFGPLDPVGFMNGSGTRSGVRGSSMRCLREGVSSVR